MPALVNVESGELEKVFLRFDQEVPLEAAVDVAVDAYQSFLAQAGIEREAYAFDTTDTPGRRSWGITVEGLGMRTPLFEVVGGLSDSSTYRITPYATRNGLKPQDARLLGWDRIGSFKPYLGRDTLEIPTHRPEEFK